MKFCKYLKLGLVILTIIGIGYFVSVIFASDTGVTSPGTVVDSADVGTRAWNNPDNAKVSDDNRAFAELSPPAISHYLKATNFGFSIPSGATINGIKVEIEKSEYDGASYDGRVIDNAVRIVKDGTIGSTDRSKSDTTYWGENDAYFEHGGSTDKWGETWTADDINSDNFGVAISAQSLNDAFAYVDHIRITVYYTEGAAAPANPTPIINFD